MAQSEEDRASALGDVTPGTASASGQAKRQMEGLEKAPQGADGGSKVPIEGGEPQPDATQAPGANRGAQNEPAIMTAGGSVPHRMIATPAGPVPVGAVARDAEHAEQLLKDQTATGRESIHSGFQPLSRKTIEMADAKGLRAAARDRGWDLGPEAGSRVTRRRFLDKQKEVLGDHADDQTQGDDGVASEAEATA